MAKKKSGIKVPTKNELIKKYGNIIVSANNTKESGLWLPSTFFAFNYTTGGGIPFGKILEIVGEASSGKAIPLYGLVLTSNGWKKMGELNLGDEVMDPVSGNPIKITGIYPQGLQPIYKITFRDGTSTECSEDHLWEVRFRSYSEWKHQVLTLKEILKRGYIKKDGGYKYSIPSTVPLNFYKRELPIHPYILGYILGDGSLNNEKINRIIFNIGVEDAESFQENITKFLKEGATLEDKGIRENPFGKAHRFILKGYGEEIKELCLNGKLSSDKFIPEDYMWSTSEDRKYLLAGLLDSDGTIGNIQKNRAKYSSRFRYSSHSEKLINQLVQLVRSLGGFITEPKKRKRERQFEGYEKRVSYEIKTGGRLPFNPFMLSRKRFQYEDKVSKASQHLEYRRAIVKIEYLGKRECQCIKVDSERGLFMLNDYIVTHNTLIAYNFAYACQQLGGHVIWVDAEQSWMNSWAKENGVDPEKVTLINDTRIEYIADAVADLAIYYRSQLTHNEPILLVIDSIAAMDCADNIDSKLIDGKAEMGGRAKALYKYFRVRSELFYRLGITQIYINQLRTALNVGFGKDSSVSTGGAALGFYASIRAAFYSGKTLTIKSKGKDRKVGKLVTIRLIKNKVAPPRPTISKCPVYFNPKFHEIGFDRCYSLEDVLVENDIIEKSSGGVYKYKGNVLARGEEKFQKLLEEGDDLRRKLLRAAEINTIGTTKKKIDKLNENYYPVEEDIEYESYTEEEEVDEDEIS